MRVNTNKLRNAVTLNAAIGIFHIAIRRKQTQRSRKIVAPLSSITLVSNTGISVYCRYHSRVESEYNV